MLDFISNMSHLLFNWCSVKIVNLLWRCKLVSIRCKNRTNRNYQRKAEDFVKF